MFYYAALPNKNPGNSPAGTHTELVLLQKWGLGRIRECEKEKQCKSVAARQRDAPVPLCKGTVAKKNISHCSTLSASIICKC